MVFPESPEKKSENMINSQELILLKDRDWNVIDGEPCRVIDFEPLSLLKEGKILGDNTLPYASVILECKKIPKKIKGYVTHKIDFIHLWTICRERSLKENEEVIICWTINNYRYKWLKYCSAIFPKMWVMVCHKGHFEFMTDPNWRSESNPQLTAEEMLTPIVSLKPDIMN